MTELFFIGRSSNPTSEYNFYENIFLYFLFLANLLRLRLRCTATGSLCPLKLGLVRNSVAVDDKVSWLGGELCCRGRKGPGTCKEGSLVFAW